jgi:hypothetical protein
MLAACTKCHELFRLEGKEMAIAGVCPRCGEAEIVGSDHPGLGILLERLSSMKPTSDEVNRLTFFLIKAKSGRASELEDDLSKHAKRFKWISKAMPADRTEWFSFVAICVGLLALIRDYTDVTVEKLPWLRREALENGPPSTPQIKGSVYGDGEFIELPVGAILHQRGSYKLKGDYRDYYFSILVEGGRPRMVSDHFELSTYSLTVKSLEDRYSDEFTFYAHNWGILERPDYSLENRTQIKQWVRLWAPDRLPSHNWSTLEYQQSKGGPRVEITDRLIASFFWSGGGRKD